MHNILVLNNAAEWHLDTPHTEIILPRTYLLDPRYTDVQNARVFNLCRSYRYQSLGYYISLLAEARGHKVIPSIQTIQDFKSQALFKIISEDFDSLIQKSLHSLKSHEFVLSIYFGKNMAQRYEQLSRRLYNAFQAPLIRSFFKYHAEEEKWFLDHIEPIGLKAVPETHIPFLQSCAREYFARKHRTPRKKTEPLLDLAILVDRTEPEPPSDKRALKKFIAAAESLNVYAELIDRNDYSRLAEFDALFIRSTTAVNHFTYRFSRRAEAEGLTVIDDPKSILTCTNKVYLSELLRRAQIPTPRTTIVHPHNKKEVCKNITFPCVLKKPDSSFSQGVIKVNSPEEFFATVEELFDSSDLTVAQEFLPTAFDWRIVILDRKPLFACQYFMVKGHWQIYHWNGTTEPHYGNARCIPLKKVPPHVLDTSLRAANLIGDGLYGVDLKEINDTAIVIEINDNPSIEAGVEDALLSDVLYRKIIRSFIRRCNA